MSSTSVPSLPPNLPDSADALRAMLLAAWAERDIAMAAHDSLAAERDRIAVERDALASQNDRLRHMLLKLRRMQFGAKSERLPEEQLQLGFEAIEQAIAQAEAEAERRHPAFKQERAARRRPTAASCLRTCHASSLRWSRRTRRVPAARAPWW